MEIAVVEFQPQGFLPKLNTFKGNFNYFEMEYYADMNLTFLNK